MTRNPGKTWGDGIVELHQNDESDAPMDADHADESAKGVPVVREVISSVAQLNGGCRVYLVARRLN